ncbi:MAG: hypothetical protein SFV54_02055 [Bryobacteraceae bacterium]|nr:hypothetical protein [Bryobacteraceae bacterium]
MIAVLIALVGAAYLMNVPQTWIVVGVVFVIGFALIALSNRRRI